MLRTIVNVHVINVTLRGSPESRGLIKISLLHFEIGNVYRFASLEIDPPDVITSKLKNSLIVHDELRMRELALVAKAPTRLR